MFTGSQSDRLQLRELIDTYSDAVMRHDADAWGQTWAENGVWRFRADSMITGRDAIVAHWTGAMKGLRAVLFVAFPGSIVVTGDQAELVSHTFEHLEPVDGPIRLQAGLYRDKAQRTDAGWRFTERSFTPRELRL